MTERLNSGIGALGTVAAGLLSAVDSYIATATGLLTFVYMSIATVRLLRKGKYDRNNSKSR